MLQIRCTSISKASVSFPFEKICLTTFPSLVTVASNLSDNALTTETPTPCNPPENW